MLQPSGTISSWQDLKDALYRPDVGAADVFAQLFVGDVLFDHSENAWYLWRGRFWQRDLKGEVVQLVGREVSARFLSLASAMRMQGDDGAKDASKFAQELCRQRTIRAVLANAGSHPQIALDGSEWDTDPWLLGTQSGVVDLRTGALLDMAAAKAARIRSVAAVEWRGLDCPAPRWEHFIAEIFGFKRDLEESVMRLLGYGITGLPADRVFPILHGTGSNGKTTLLKIIQQVLGKALVMQTDARSLMQSQHAGNAEGPRPFLRDLQGKRLVLSVEAKADAELDVALVKWATGRDAISARRLHENVVEFQPSHMLLLGTNYKPKAPANDEALWDRIMMIPFTERFVDNPTLPNEHKRDSTLVESLVENEGPGILAWLVRGCLEWQQHGLQPADAVLDATQAYKVDATADDPIEQFIAEMCEQDPSFTSTAAALFAAWEMWAVLNGYDKHTSTWFGTLMKSHFNRKTSGVVYYEGVRVKNP